MRVVKTSPSQSTGPRLPLHHRDESPHPPTAARSRQRKIALPTMEGIHFEKVSEITCLEAQGNYTLLYFGDKRRLLVCKTLQAIEQLISTPLQFVRVHRSFTITLDQLQRYVRGKGGYVIMENGSHVNVSAGRKQVFLETGAQYFSA